MIVPFLIKRFILTAKRNPYTMTIVSMCAIGIAMSVAVLMFTSSTVLGYLYDHFKGLTAARGHIVISNFTDSELPDFTNIDNFDFSVRSATAETVSLPTKGHPYSMPFKVFGMGYDNGDLAKYNEHNMFLDIFAEGPLEKYEILIGMPFRNTYKIGDKIKVLISDPTLIEGSKAKPGMGTITLTVKGYFDAGSKLINRGLIMASYDAAKEIGGSKASYELMIFVNNIFNVDKTKSEILDKGIPYIIHTWKQINANYLNIITVNLFMVFVFMVSLMAVCILNIASGVIAMIISKRNDIVLLKTLGLSDFRCFAIFFTIGIVICLIATVIGLILGTIFSYNLHNLQNICESLGLIDFSSWKQDNKILEVRGYLGVEIYLTFSVMSLILSALASSYPAYKAMKINYNTVLRD